MTCSQQTRKQNASERGASARSRAETRLHVWQFVARLVAVTGFLLTVGLTSGRAQSNTAPNSADGAANAKVTVAESVPANPPNAPQTPSNPEATNPEATTSKPSMDLYGFLQLDMIYDIKVNNPDWFDVNRPSKLPSFSGEFGKDGNTYASVRQTRFGVKGAQPTSLGELKYQFEFDMFGVGVDAGQTTIRPRHYYGEIGPVLAGQTNSVFMDINIFPNILDYWGPNGMVFLRNPQLRYTPLNGNTTLEFALEKPGASGDAGVIADRIDLTNIHARFQFPDLTGAIGYAWKNKSYIRGAAVVRSMKIDNVANNRTQSLVGWGVDLSSNIVIHKDVLRLQYVVGTGIENYMNDAPVDVGPELQPNPLVPIKGRPIPMYSFVAYLDHSWSDKWTTAIGYSELLMQNTGLQTPDAFHQGQYASVNLLYSPFKTFMTGGEFQFGKRTNFSSGFNANDYRVQLSFKYSFDFKVIGKTVEVQ